MRRLIAGWIAGAIVIALSPANLGAQTPAAVPTAAAPSAAAQAQPALGTTEKRPAAPTKHRAWTRADARVCLEFPTDLQIIKCSEKYRYVRVPL
jgi:hypothetical protein